jgi:hypothetical protein
MRSGRRFCRRRFFLAANRPANVRSPLPAAHLSSLALAAASSCSHELLPKNSNNSPRDTISQNNSIVISVCNLACAARFRANAGAKSVGMIDRPHAHPYCLETTLTGRCSSLPSVKSGNIRCWQKLKTASDRPGSRHHQAAGAIGKK